MYIFSIVRVSRHLRTAPFFSVCLLAFALLSASQQVTAQVTDSVRVTNRYSFALVGVPLDEALTVLMERTQISIVFESGLVNGKTSSCRIEVATSTDVLRCVLKNTGIDFYTLSSGTHILTPDALGKPVLTRLAGRVVDDDSGTPIPDANVVLVDSNTGSATDVNGQFVFAGLSSGPHVLVISHLAYRDQTDTLWTEPDRTNRWEIRLSERTIRSEPVVVNDLERRRTRLPLGGDESDILNLRTDVGVEISGAYGALLDVAGVQTSGSFGSAGIQGGNSGDHQYVLDGAPLFVPIRNGGLIGPISSFAVRSMSVHKAGFDARYGSHLSGSIALEHELGSSDNATFDIQASTLSLEGRIGGIVKSSSFPTTRWMIAGRQSLLDSFRPDGMNDRFRNWSAPDAFLSSELTNGDPINEATIDSAFTAQPVSLSYSDFHAAARMEFKHWRTLYASVYVGSNRFGNDALETFPGLIGVTADEYAWSNRLSQIRYSWIQGNRALVRIGAWTSSYRLSNPFSFSPLAPLDGQRQPDQEEFNEILAFGLNAGADIALNTHHTISVKLELRNTDSDFSLNLDPRQGRRILDPGSVRPISSSWRFFAEDVIRTGASTTITAGTRLTYIPAQQRVYAEPRLSVRADLDRGTDLVWSFRVSGGLYRQFLNQFDIASSSVSALLPGFRFWIPLGVDDHPPTAYHVSFDALLSIRQRTRIRAEVYLKRLAHLIDVNYSDPSNTDAPVLATGNGNARGLALSISHEGKILSTEAGYEYSFSSRRIEGRFDNRTLSAPWEQPHILRLSVGWNITGSWVLSARWRSVYGRKWAFRQAYYDYLEPVVEQRIFGVVDLSNPDRQPLPVSSQLDIGVSFSQRIGGARLEAKLSVLNVLDRKNVIDRRLVRDARQGFRSVNRNDLPVLPLLSIRLRR